MKRLLKKGKNMTYKISTAIVKIDIKRKFKNNFKEKEAIKDYKAEKGIKWKKGGNNRYSKIHRLIKGKLKIKKIHKKSNL